jgi:hypothetical protein
MCKKEWLRGHVLQSLLIHQIKKGRFLRLLLLFPSLVNYTLKILFTVVNIQIGDSKWGRPSGSSPKGKECQSFQIRVLLPWPPPPDPHLLLQERSIGTNCSFVDFRLPKTDIIENQNMMRPWRFLWHKRTRRLGLCVADAFPKFCHQRWAEMRLNDPQKSAKKWAKKCGEWTISHLNHRQRPSRAHPVTTAGASPLTKPKMLGVITGTESP